MAPRSRGLKVALGWLAAGIAAGAWGLSLLEEGGPCTLHIALVGLVVILAGVTFVVTGLVALVAALRGPGA